jgi:hypothetical protein
MRVVNGRNSAAFALCGTAMAGFVPAGVLLPALGLWFAGKLARRKHM